VAEFKPMVKMMTTEPSVVLKLKKGGSATHEAMKKAAGEHGHKPMNKADGGLMGALATTPALLGRPALAARVATPGKPSMAMRRKAMSPKSMPPMSAAVMKKGGEAESPKEHKAEMTKMGKLEGELKKHEGMRAGKAHPGLKGGGSTTAYADTVMHSAKADANKGPTGGVKMGNAGGFKSGGKAKKYATGGTVEGNEAEYVKTKVVEAKANTNKGPTEGVKFGNAGGFKRGGMAKKFAAGGSTVWENRPADTASPGVSNSVTGEVKKANAGGFKKGGALKKHFAAGGTVDNGRPTPLIPRGKSGIKAQPVRINSLSGTYKSGGKVTPAEGRLKGFHKAENSTAMREAKMDTTLKYKKGGHANGGAVEPETAMQRAFRKHYENETAENEGLRRSVSDALMYVPRKASEMMRGLGSALKGQGSVTDTERTVSRTVSSPGKKRGGLTC